jgi:TonB-linked SusC/RagA family outer membrane protein
MMKSLYRTGLALLFAAALLPALASAQQAGTVTGRVLERGTLRPIPDATVIIVGSGIATRTNQDGVFRLSGVAQGPLQLRATRIGFAAGSQTINVGAGGNEAVDFQLGQVATQLDVVVTSAVTGQVERAREVGTNVGTISVAQINKAPINRFSDILQGRTAGVSLQQTSGTTGTGQRLNIRGANSLSLSNEPLVYVDGMQVSNGNILGYGVGGQAISRLNDISSEAIEKVEVLKGPAATAIYGTTAANGVLLITTKRGRSGAARWNAYDETGTQEDITNYPANYLRYRLLTAGAPVYLPSGAFNVAARVACFNHNAALPVGTAGACTPDSAVSENTLLDPRTRPFTVGHLSKMGGSVAGGSDATQYYFNVDNNTEHGVVSFNTLQTLSTRANINTQLLKNLDFSLSSQYNRSKLALNSNDNSVFSPLINGYVGSAFFSPPNADGSPSSLNYRSFSMKDLSQYVSHQNIDRFNVGGVANWRPLSWLSGNANLGMDYFTQFDNLTVQPGQAVGTIAPTSLGIGERDSNHENTYLWTGTGSASASWDPLAALHTRLTAGGSYNRSLRQGTNGSGNGIVAGTANLGATSSLFLVGENFSEVKSIGIFSRLEMAWKDRLFVTGSLRRDDNSAFGVNFGFITYPGVSGSWVVSDEPWFPKSDLFSNLRLRSAYGQSGTRPNFRDAVTSFNPVSVSVNNVELSGVTIFRTGNLSLKPELTKETEFGGDISFLKDRVSLEVTAFNKRSQDALISVPMAPSFGLTGSTVAGTTILRNLGALRNKGTETQLDLKVFDNDQMGLNIRGTATSLKNTVLVIGQDATGKDLPDIVINRGNQRHRKGYSAGAFFQRPVFFNDANGDGLLARSEITLGDTAAFIGDAIPTWNRTISGDLKIFRYITISTLIEGRGGNKTLNFSEQFRCASGISFGDRGCSATGNPTASLKEQAAFLASQFGGTSATGGPAIAGTSQAGYIENGGFTKWRELAITLQAPDNWRFLHAGGARGASISLAGRNLKTWTRYTGVDPEIIEAATSSFNQSEFNTQPIPRIYTFRVNLNF